METLRIFRSKWMVLTGIALLLPLLGGCQDDGLPDGEGAVVSLNQIPDNPDYISLPLVGTRWKLIGFADGRRNRIKLAHSAGESSYTLIFDESGVVSGRTFANLTYGKYSMENEQLLILDFSEVTEINKLFDDDSFIESMNEVFAFQISSKGLVLYYGTQKYLLFNPVE